jgi:hypothetical protein
LYRSTSIQRNDEIILKPYTCGWESSHLTAVKKFVLTKSCQIVGKNEASRANVCREMAGFSGEVSPRHGIDLDGGQ